MILSVLGGPSAILPEAPSKEGGKIIRDREIVRDTYKLYDIESQHRIILQPTLQLRLKIEGKRGDINRRAYIRSLFIYFKR